MKYIKKYLALLLSLFMMVSGIQLVSAAEENTMQIVLEDITGSADTLMGEARVKVSVKGIDGSLTLSQLKFHFSGDGAFKSIAYANAINQLVKESGAGQPFFVQPVDAKSANSSKEFTVAFSGGAQHSLPVSADGTEICTITFTGEPEKELTLAIDNLEDSFCVESPNLIRPENHIKKAVSITVKFSSTTNQGVKATVLAELDELKKIGGFSDPSDIRLKLTNLATNQERTFGLSDAEKKDAVSYQFEIDGLAAGKYDIQLLGNGFVSKTVSADLTSNKEIKLTSKHFYAGDVAADGKLTIRDYNRFVSLYDAKAAAFSGVDYNRDGKFTQDDLYAMITSVGNHIEPDGKGTVQATLTAKSSSASVKKGDTFTITLALDASSKEVNTYYIKGTYPSDIATLTKAECMETAEANKAINEIGDGSFTLLNKVSDGSKKDLYKLTFQAEKTGTFKLAFTNIEGALAFDTTDQLLAITAQSDSITVTVSSGDSSGGGGSGGGGGGGGGGGTTSPSNPTTPSNPSNPSTPSTPGTDNNYHAAYVTGYEDNTIRPDSNITRAEAAAMISRISADFDANMTYDVSAFSDVGGEEWYAVNVGYAAQKEIVKGYEDGSFRPNDSITREEFATMICRFMNYEAAVGESFADVPDGHWAKGYIDAMKAKGILSGYEDGSFGLGRQIVRAEAITMINRALGRTPDEAKVAAYVAENGYPATDIEGHWAAAQILEAVVSHNETLLH